MFQRNRRGFRRRSNGRGHSSHQENGYRQARPRSNSFSSNQPRNNFRPTQSAEKLFEKYNVLAKEAISSGDKTLVENYLQHADHFARIIEDKNRNKDNVVAEAKVDDKPSSPDVNIKQEDLTKGKE